MAVKPTDLAIGRRAVVEQKKILYRHLEDIIEWHTNKAATYSREDVKQVVMDVASGAKSYRKAAMDAGISYHTINTWKRNGWVYEAVEIAKEICQDQLDRRFTGVINKALDNVNTALDKGDGYVGKDGKIKHKPVSAKDNALIAAIAFDKRQLIRGEATEINESKDSKERLKELQEQFKKFAMREEKTIDGTAERINEQRAERETTEYADEPEVSGQLGLNLQEEDERPAEG